MQEEKSLYPSEVIDLPSEGKLYSTGSPLSSGKIELKYPTAKEEDILTSKNLIQKGIVIDAFINSIVVDSSINLDEMLLGDKNAIIVASRILAYGKDYPISVDCPRCGAKNEITVDISELGTKEVSLDTVTPGVNEFELTLPASKAKIKFKLLTQSDEKEIDLELKNLKKLMKANDSEITTRLRHAIISVNGNNEVQAIKKFVDTMLSIDSLALRKKISEVSPDVDMNFDFTCSECGHSERMVLPLGIQFFWPSGRI